MKIRSYVIFCFLIAAVLPTIIVSTWSYRETVAREYAEVKDRHLLLARKAASALEQYQRNVVAAVETIGMQVTEPEISGDYGPLFEHLHIVCVGIAEKASGKTLFLFKSGRTATEPHVAPQLVALLIQTAQPGKAAFSNITVNPAGDNRIYLAIDKGDHLLIGVFKPDYIVALGKSIVFGEAGHAAIVDRSGNVIAHPREDWIASRHNLAGVDIVARMMKGETGIGEFFSPAVSANMIAGFTTVAGPGWGVMVPQPVSEIHDKAGRIHSSLVPTIIGALTLVCLIGLFLARSLSRPIEDLARAMHVGALKQKLSPLKMPKSLVRFRETEDVCQSYNTMVTRMALAGEQIEKLAFSDHVTGLPNREHLHLRAQPILEEAIDPARGGIILLIDLDNFKEINDVFGHHAGDQHLKACARTLAEAARSIARSPAAPPDFAEPIVARIGGDEFIVLIQGLVNGPDIDAFLQDVCTAMAAPGAELNMTPSASIGCARFPEDGVVLTELIKRADIAMYHAKRSGKNQTQIYTPAIGIKSVSEIRRDLASAIETGKLFLEYQPKICTHTRKVISIEALARWNHPELGLFMPKHWVPQLMGSHAMPLLGEWVIAAAMRDLEAIHADGHDLWMSVNIGSDHFVSSGFVDKIEALRSSQGFLAGDLEFEVTEDTLFESEDRAIEVFNRLHSLGYKISIDDFGVGYSNITRLANLPVDYLKIDQSIITGAGDNPRIRTILSSTISMARDLSCATVAEGIATRKQAEFATELGADCLQGFYFTECLRLDGLLTWLNRQKGPAVHPYLKAGSDLLQSARN